MSVKRNVIANYLGQIFASGLALALVPFYIRYLSIEAYALVGLFAVIQVWLSLLDLGMTPTLGREMARFTAGAAPIQYVRDLLRTLEIVCFAIAVAIVLVLSLASGFLATHWLRADHLPTGTVASALSIVAFVIALRFCEGIYRSAIMGLQQQVWLNAAQTVLAVLRSVGAIAVLAFWSPTIQAFFVWQGLISLLSIAVMAAKLYLAIPAAARPGRFSGAALREVRGFAGGMIGMTVLGVALTQVDKILLSRLLPLDQFGYYMLASTMTGAMYLVIGPLLQAVTPAFVRLLVAGDEQRLATFYHQTSQSVTVLLAPAALVLTMFPFAALYAWSGDATLAAHTAPILAILSGGTFLNALMQTPHQLQLADGWTSLAVKMNIIAVITLMPALLLAVPAYGPVAAAVIWAGLNAAYLLVGVPLLHRRLLRGEFGRWWLADVAAPAAAAAAVIGSVWLATRGLALDRVEWLLLLAVTGSASLLAAALAATTIRVRMADAARTLRRRWTMPRRARAEPR